MVPSALFLGSFVALLASPTPPIPAPRPPAGAPPGAHHLFLREGQAGARFGAAVASAGDVDRDGRTDVAVGAPRAGRERRGNVRVFSGADGALLLELWGGEPDARFGEALASVGDLDGDGAADLVIGAPGTGAGGATVVSGASGAVLLTLTGETAGDRFGQAVCGPGDVDGDGRVDVAVGAPHHDAGGPSAGRVDVLSGVDGALLARADGGAAFDLLGSALAAPGDLDGDGRGDVVVGAPLADGGAFNGGGLLGLRGLDASVLFACHGQGIGDQLGLSLATAGDVDLDGTPDVIAGAPGADQGGIDAGAAYVVSGAPSAGGALLLVVPGSGEAEYQHAVGGPGDVDLDGVPDLAVGSASAGGETGRVRLVSGADGSVLATFVGRHPNDWYGAALCALGDANGDGHPDLAVGAPGHDDVPEHEGWLQVLSCVPLPPGAVLRARAPSVGPPR